MTDKRGGVTSPLMSKPIKKLKLNETGSLYKENINDLTKIRTKPSKTTYFFQPTNTLAYRSNATTDQKEGVPYAGDMTNVLNESDRNSMGSTMVPAVPQIKTPSKTYDKYEKFIQEQQSSDDSFDGIRWRASPHKVTGKVVNGVPSSPLKNTISPRKREDALKLSTLINEQANSVLSKYGAGFHNILSQTPTMTRTHSDISSSESVHKKCSGTQQSPSLTRARSFGIDCLATSKTISKLHKFERPKSKSATPKTAASFTNFTSLNSWIDKFDKSNPRPSFSPCALDLMTTASSVNEPINSTPQSHHIDDKHVCETSEFRTENIIEDVLQGIDFSDDFSDSGLMTSPNKPEENGKEDIIQNDSDDPFSSDDELVLTAMRTQSKHLESSSESQLINNDESDDPFSEDDFKFTQFETKLETRPTPTDRKHLSTHLNTQEMSDIRHAESFQDDVKRLESLQVSGKSHNGNNFNELNDAKLSYSRLDLQRFQIKSILNNTYKVQNRVRNQAILAVVDGKHEELKLIVRGEYLQLDFQIGDVVHLILTDASHPKLVDDTHNLLIWNPDILVSATTVSQQMGCPRKSVLMNRLSFPCESSIPLIVGVIIHEIFQTCFHTENWELKYMKTLMEYEIQSKLLEIYSIGNEVDKVRSEIQKQLPYLETWFKTYYKKCLSSNTSIPSNHGNQKIMFAVNKALDIEENIWSPMFGLKGKVDVTLEGQLFDQHTSGNFLLPMEIKTGKEYISHHAQSSLYSLLFKDRYDMDVNMFLLVYTKERLSKKYDISRTDLKSLVNLRNRITKYFKSGTRELPELIRQSQCDRCEVQQACMTINKLVENGTAEQSGLSEGIYDTLTFHLESDENAKQFYNYWDNLITQEEGIMANLKKDLWTLTAKERENSKGKAVSDLIIKESNDNDDFQEKFFYTFERPNTSQSLQNSQLIKHDRIIISDQEGHFAIAQGFITAIRPSFIKVSANRRIINSSLKLDDFNETNNQKFQGALHKNLSAQKQNKLYRIDKDDMFHGMGLARYNILNLFLKDGDSRRREIIVNLKEPKFRSSKLHYDATSGNFNSDQIGAFNKIISTEDYTLVLGMPGTGKTTVIAQIIKFLVQNKKTVLLTSYTHSAVDNILLKLKVYGIDILRIGSPLKVHKDIRKYVPGFDGNKQINDYNDFITTYKTPSVIATTCLGIGDIAFNLRTHFDYCIIDEASQVSLPISLGPLRFCEKFVLVGDHNQLPPLVQHPNPAIKQGLSRSLFKLLSDAYPDSVAELTYQYRMCEEIMLLSNVLIYNGRLKCGSEKVATQSLYIPYPNKMEYQISPEFSQLQKNDLWIDNILKPENKVIFVNHDEVPGIERTIGEKVENLVEVDLIKQIVESLTMCGVEESSIGVMSLYRSQLRLLHRGLLHKPDVEVLTADQFQGRDKDCIIISLVRSNNESKVGDLLKEWRRVNVAITRSKSKLIILGSKSTLKCVKMLEAFMGLIESRGWMYDLPARADKFYEFAFSETPKCSMKSFKPKVNQNLKPDSKLINNNPIIRDIINDITSE